MQSRIDSPQSWVCGECRQVNDDEDTKCVNCGHKGS
jgi:hypothetical protein